MLNYSPQSFPASPARVVCGRTPVTTRLLREWNAADHQARVAFARAVGAERVFDVVTEAVG
jgi:hypothetical protein